jgi:hypothetical protein
MTSCWFSQLPDGYCRIGISRGVPRCRKGYRRYNKLCPGPWFRSVDADTYKRLYSAEVLDILDPQKVVDELVAISDGDVPVLLCFETTELPITQGCHRALVSAWLHEKLGLEVYEYGLESHGFAWEHPMLHPSFRSDRRS